ncbi:MAG: hypothetical protein ABIN79_05385 [Marmoricola sp.]
MRGVAVILLAVFLVNLPFVQELRFDREVDSSGKPAVAEVLATSSVGDRHFVDYRLPGSLDPRRVRYSARVDDQTFAAAKETDQVAVEVVPGKPEVHRLVGRVTSRVFLVVAVGADLLLLLGAMAYWRRRRRWRLHEVLSVEAGQDEDTASLRWGELVVTARVPSGWATRVSSGDRVPGSLHLAADGDVLPSRVGSEGLEQVSGTAYVVRGRVRDARAGRVDLDLDGTLTLRVHTGTHRIRADIRDLTEVTGTLTFTPS